MPAGIEIIIAMQKPKAMITNKARTLRLEIFLTALVNTPNQFTFQNIPKKRTTKKRGLRKKRVLSVAAIVSEISKLFTVMLCIFGISLLGCRFFINDEDLLNDFSELYPNLTLIKIV